MSASGTPCESSSTVSFSGQRVCMMRVRRSSRSASGKSMVNGRSAVSPATFWVVAATWTSLVGADDPVPPSRTPRPRDTGRRRVRRGDIRRAPYVIWPMAGAAVTWSNSSSIPRPHEGGSISTHAQLPGIWPVVSGTVSRGLHRPSLRFVGGVLLLAVAYLGAAKLGQTLRYTASVGAIWPPAGLGIAALYLWGTRWWPGVLLGELLVNGELLLDDGAYPLGSLVGQQVGNMAEIVVGALLLRRLVGPGAAMDRVDQVGRMLVAVGAATAISATIGTASMVAGDVVDASNAGELWRTWWLADTCARA